MKPKACILLGAAAVFAGASTVLGQTDAGQGAAPKSKTAAKAGAAAASRGAFDRALLRPALLKAQAPERFQVKFVTTKGEFTVTVTRAWSPLGADRFYNLVRHHFYDGASFFRAVPNFVVQFGLSAYPQVSGVWENANINDDPAKQGNKRGYLTFAKTNAPNSRSTQVFINLKDNDFLDNQGFAPFGTVDNDGMTVVDSLYSGYGDVADPAYQDKIAKEGKAFLDKSYPKLDAIKVATLVGAAATKPAAAKPGAKPGASKPAPQKP